MIVCHCNRVTASDIEAVCLGGASTAREVRMACGAGNRCGGCRPLVQMLVSKHHECSGERSFRENTVAEPFATTA
jgi:bacterioferritin-associated ferredoxin